jgi:hypothetical protein
MVKHSTSHKYKVEFKHYFSYTDRWMVRKNDSDFGRFIEILYARVWRTLGRSFVIGGIYVQ